MNYHIDKFGVKTALPGEPNDTLIPLPDADTYKQLERIATELENLHRMADSAEEQAEAAKEQADAAEKQARLAEEESAAATAEAQKARRQSRISNAIAITAIIVALLAWLVPREAVYAAISSFVQSL